MNYLIFIALALALALIGSSPAFAQNRDESASGATFRVVMDLDPATGRLSAVQLLNQASHRGLCRDLSPVRARMRILQPQSALITCASPTAIVPLIGLAGVGGVGAAVAGTALLVGALGGGGGTPSTN